MNRFTSLTKPASSDYRRIAILFGAALLVIVAAFLITSDRSPGYRGAVDYVGRLLLVSLEAVLYFGLALVWFDFAITWYHAIKLLGFPAIATLRENRRMARCMAEHKSVFGLHTAILLALFMAIGFSLSHRFTFLGIAIVSTVCMHFSSDTLRPAAVLYLANTAPKKIELQVRIKRYNFHYRVVALLDVDDTIVGGRSEDEWLQIIIGNDCMRTDAAEDGVWQGVVESLLGQVPLVVLDARDASPAVVFESKRIHSLNVTYKTLFVVGPSGEAPVLDEVAQELTSPLRVATVKESIAPEIVSLFLASRKNLPSISRPTSEILSPFVGATTDHAVEVRELCASTVTDVAINIGLGIPVHSDRPRQFSRPARMSKEGSESCDASIPPRGSTSERLGQKCSRCFRRQIYGEWVCPYCGQAKWFDISVTLATGLGFVAIATFAVESWIWRGFWFAVAAIPIYVGGSWCVMAWIAARKNPGKP